MRCSSGKLIINNETLAQEELIRVSIKYREGEGRPNGYYKCNTCGGYHLTSKSTDTSFIKSKEVQERIKKGRLGLDWEF
jgi:hypothetical protein